MCRHHDRNCNAVVCLGWKDCRGGSGLVCDEGSEIGHTRYKNAPPQHGTIALSDVHRRACVPIGEATNHDNRPGGRCSPESGIESSAVAIIRTIKNIGEREAVNAPRGLVFKKPGSVCMNESDVPGVVGRLLRGHLTEKKRMEIWVGAVGVAGEATYHPLPHDLTHLQRENIEEPPSIRHSKKCTGEKSVQQQAERPGIKPSGPVLQLLPWVVQIEKRANPLRPPTGDRSQNPHTIHEPLNAAGSGRFTTDPSRSICQLARIDIDGDHFMVPRQADCSASC